MPGARRLRLAGQARSEAGRASIGRCLPALRPARVRLRAFPLPGLELPQRAPCPLLYKTRGLCPSCAAKRTAAWAAWVTADLVRPVPHRQLVVTLPKLIRPYFEFDRTLLTDLSRWTYECLSALMQGLACEPVRPGCVTVLQLAGNLLNRQPHLHALVTSGAFDFSGTRFYPLPPGFLAPLEVAIRDRVLRGLFSKGVLPLERYRLLMSWRHNAGFSVHVGPPVAPTDSARLERLARYVRRSHLAESRIVYREADDRVVYSSGKAPHPGFRNSNFRVFKALDFVAAVAKFVPDRYQHESLAYGEYANAVRGRRRKAAAGEGIVVQPVSTRRAHEAWRELMKRVFEVDPLRCRCGGELRFVAVITERAVVERILRWIGRWPPPKRLPKPRSKPPPPPVQLPLLEFEADHTSPSADESQLPHWWDDDTVYSQVPPQVDD